VKNFIRSLTTTVDPVISDREQTQVNQLLNTTLLRKKTIYLPIKTHVRVNFNDFPSDNGKYTTCSDILQTVSMQLGFQTILLSCDVAHI